MAIIVFYVTKFKKINRYINFINIFSFYLNVWILQKQSFIVLNPHYIIATENTIN